MAADARQIAASLVRSEIQDTRAELAEHVHHVQACEQRLALLLSIQEALQASPSLETDQ